MENTQKFEIGEIVGVYKYDSELEKDVLRKCFIRFKEEEQYYVTFLDFDKGYEYLGYPDDWIDEDEIEKLDGKILQELKMRHTETGAGKEIEGYTSLRINDVISIEVNYKSCKNRPDDDFNNFKKCRDDECSCILPRHLITLKDGSKLKIFEYDAELISRMNRIKIENPIEPQQSLFSFI